MYMRRHGSGGRRVSECAERKRKVETNQSRSSRGKNKDERRTVQKTKWNKHWTKKQNTRHTRVDSPGRAVALAGAAGGPLPLCTSAGGGGFVAVLVLVVFIAARVADLGSARVAANENEKVWRVASRLGQAVYTRPVGALPPASERPRDVAGSRVRSALPSTASQHGSRQRARASTTDEVRGTSSREWRACACRGGSCSSPPRR